MEVCGRWSSHSGPFCLGRGIGNNGAEDLHVSILGIWCLFVARLRGCYEGYDTCNEDLSGAIYSIRGRTKRQGLVGILSGAGKASHVETRK